MISAQRAYRVLLRAYPADFRARYGREMTLLFRDQLTARRRADDAGNPTTALRFWLAVLGDVACSAPALRAESVRARWHTLLGRSSDRATHFHRRGDIMSAKGAVAVLAMLGGTFEILNAGADLMAGSGTGHDVRSQLALGLAALMGGLLVAAGVALMRGGAERLRWTRGAALASLALVAGVLVLYPFMSIFARIVGIAIPLALLLVARPTRDSSIPSMV